MRWLRGGGMDDDDAGRLAEAVGLAAVYRAQGGLLDDLDTVAAALYGRLTTGAQS
jgi:hypothetical protein